MPTVINVGSKGSTARKEPSAVVQDYSVMQEKRRPSEDTARISRISRQLAPAIQNHSVMQEKRGPSEDTARISRISRQLAPAIQNHSVMQEKRPSMHKSVSISCVNGTAVEPKELKERYAVSERHPSHNVSTVFLHG
ncbi:unnamed protein product [Didymodactylos carnosus]|uniref:Uncharacterized protein n=1 Tax=Didymodactylos carnosus TaxID=1234261 RepID=A0A8S2PCU0_9BILA|nr:unnamed protein product [Didymodactylos carnosus]CAF4043395.1 unnamed protein product [Didymodactylos carnosus]